MESVREKINRNLNDAQQNKLNTRGTLIMTSWLVFLSFAAIVYLSLDYFLFHRFFTGNGNNEISKLGTFGDFIGGAVGTVVSVATVLLIWLTYQAQKEELAELRKQGAQQLEVQALSALITHYTNEVATIDEFFVDQMPFIGERTEEEKKVLQQQENRREYYATLLTIAENELTSKVKILNGYRHILSHEEKKEE